MAPNSEIPQDLITGDLGGKKNVTEWVKNGETTPEAKALANALQAKIEALKTSTSVELLKEYKAVFDSKILTPDSYDSRSVLVNETYKNQGVLSVLEKTCPVLAAQFRDMPDLRYLAYESATSQVPDVDVLPMGSTVRMKAGQVFLTRPGKLDVSFMLFPWDARAAVDDRYKKLTATPAPAPTPAAEPVAPTIEVVPSTPAPTPASVEPLRDGGSVQLSSLEQMSTADLVSKMGETVKKITEDLPPLKTQDSVQHPERAAARLNQSFEAYRVFEKDLTAYEQMKNAVQTRAGLSDADNNKLTAWDAQLTSLRSEATALMAESKLYTPEQKNALLATDWAFQMEHLNGDLCKAARDISCISSDWQGKNNPSKIVKIEKTGEGENVVSSYKVQILVHTGADRPFSYDSTDHLNLFVYKDAGDKNLIGQFPHKNLDELFSALIVDLSQTTTKVSVAKKPAVTAPEREPFDRTAYTATVGQMDLPKANAELEKVEAAAKKDKKNPALYREDLDQINILRARIDQLQSNK